MTEEQRIQEASTLGSKAGRIGLSEHCRPWSCYTGKLGKAWEEAYEKAKKEEDRTKKG